MSEHSEHSAEVQALIDQYSTKQEQPEFTLSQNGVNRMQEYMRSTGYDNTHPDVLKKATLQALAEQKPKQEWGTGVGKSRVGGSGFQGRSLADHANNK